MSTQYKTARNYTLVGTHLFTSTLIDQLRVGYLEAQAVRQPTPITPADYQAIGFANLLDMPTAGYPVINFATIRILISQRLSMQLRCIAERGVQVTRRRVVWKRYGILRIPYRGQRVSRQSTPGLACEAKKLDPTRPVIKDSRDSEDLESGDAHDYRGSLNGGRSTYMDIFGSKEKLSTEFGVDAPPAAANLRAIPEVADRLSEVLPRISELHDYQYHLVKYYIEHYRIQKYSSECGLLFIYVDRFLTAELLWHL
jgi:hypothetical protein